MPATATQVKWLRAAATGRPVGVDRENRVLQGFVVAQSGVFKEKDPRGEFDLKSLRGIAALMKREPKGLKSRFTHPDLSSDGLGNFLGRAKSPTIETIKVNRHGEELEVQAIRADLHFSESASKTPNGDLAGYVMDLADEDPDALSSSLVIEPIEEYRLNKDGTRQHDEETGMPLPPLWRPVALHATDIVDTGAAVDGLLSAQLSTEGLPDEVVRQAAAMLKKQFAGKDRAFVEPRLRGWVDRVLSAYWPEIEAEEETDAEPPPPAGHADVLRRRLQLRRAA
jgi:hypothetical protein